MALLQLYGGIEVLDRAEKLLARTAGVQPLLDQLRWLAQRLEGVNVSFDLADLRGYAYYSGTRFAIYVPGASDALVRGGRYDEVGAVFGRNRPAAGFSLDIKQLVAVVPERPLKSCHPCALGRRSPGGSRHRGIAPAGRDRGLRAARP